MMLPGLSVAHLLTRAFRSRALPSMRRHLSIDATQVAGWYGCLISKNEAADYPHAGGRGRKQGQAIYRASPAITLPTSTSTVGDVVYLRQAGTERLC